MKRLKEKETRQQRINGLAWDLCDLLQLDEQEDLEKALFEARELIDKHKDYACK